MLMPYYNSLKQKRGRSRKKKGAPEAANKLGEVQFICVGEAGLVVDTFFFGVAGTRFLFKQDANTFL